MLLARTYPLRYLFVQGTFPAPAQSHLILQPKVLIQYQNNCTPSIYVEISFAGPCHFLGQACHLSRELRKAAGHRGGINDILDPSDDNLGN